MNTERDRIHDGLFIGPPSPADPPNGNVDGELTGTVASALALRKLVDEELARVLAPPTPIERRYALDCVLAGRSEVDFASYARARAEIALSVSLGGAHQCATAAAATVSGIDGQLRDLARKRDGTNRYYDEVTDKKAWTALDVFSVVMLFAVSVSLLASDLNTIASVLVASGVPGMDDKASCLLWTLIPAGIAFAVKSLGLMVHLETHRRYFTAAVWSIGLILSLAWAWLFPNTFDPRLGQSVSDLIAGVTSVGGVNSKGVWLITVGMVGTAFLAAGCWLTIELIAASHRVTRRHDGHPFKKMECDHARLDSIRGRTAIVKGRIDGRVREIEARIDTYISEAKTQFGLARVAHGFQRDVFAAFQSGGDLPNQHNDQAKDKK